MRNRSEGKRIFVQVARLSEQGLEKIRPANIMDQIAEKTAAERIVSEILNDAPTVTVAMRRLEFFLL